MNAVLENDVVARIREQAAQRFAQLGWPTTRVEEWKYTSLAALQKRVDSGALRRREPLAPVPPVTLPFSFRGSALAELVFVDGIFDEASSDPGQSDGISLATLRTAPAALLEKYFARFADYENHPLTAMNTAGALDGAVIEVTAPVEGFIHLVFIGSDGYESHPRNLVVVARGARIAIVETYAGSGSYFTNSVTEIVAGEGAVVDHYKLGFDSPEAVHIGTAQIHEERAASVTSRAISLGGALVRNETNAALTGEGASLVLDGLYVVDGKRHVDNHTVIEHAQPHCESIELYKGILDGEARGIFDGKIVVAVGAKKTVARQTNKNLLLSETAIADSKPTLEIFNDDVKCNHGSTIGQLDEEAMFYLRSRGIGEDEARGLLVFAFASEIVDRMKVDVVREQVRRAMFSALPQRLPERRGGSR